MVGSENTGRESCGDGIAPDAAYDCGHDCQSEVFLSVDSKDCGIWLRIWTHLWHSAPVLHFVYSTYALFAMTEAQLRGDMEQVMGYMHEFYF